MHFCSLYVQLNMLIGMSLCMHPSDSLGAKGYISVIAIGCLTLCFLCVFPELISYFFFFLSCVLDYQGWSRRQCEEGGGGLGIGGGGKKTCLFLLWFY